MVEFIQGSSVEHTSWAYISDGIRMGLDLGAHRKNAYGVPPTVEKELMKRAFSYVVVYFSLEPFLLVTPSVIVVLSWGLAFALGRPCPIHSEECVSRVSIPSLSNDMDL